MKASNALHPTQLRAIGFGGSRVLLAVILLPLFAGCTLGRLQVGEPIDAGSASALYAGQTKAEVLERLGPPDRVSIDRDEAVFEFLYRENLDRELDLSFFQANFDYEQVWLRSDRLVVRFDSRGRVRDYGINLQTRSTR